ncbi:MAG: hypothetical protein ISS81_05580 [Candidatus Marinimicrobia bacterium]|nr:hypothetical protein [Candidatus Neomarinimicrobiota bacterium]
MPALFAKAELATALPKAGGSYFFIERSMGSEIGYNRWVCQLVITFSGDPKYKYLEKY